MSSPKDFKNIAFDIEVPEEALKRVNARIKAAGFASLDDYAKHCLLRSVAPDLIEIEEDNGYAHQLLGQHAALSEACDTFVQTIKARNSVDMSRLPDVLENYWRLRHALQSVVSPFDCNDISFDLIKP